MKNSFPEKNRLTKRLYSVAEASVYLGRSANGVRELVWSGKLPYVKVDRRVHIDVNDMDDWIEKNKTQFTF